jgi:hypothetical protein
MALVDEDLADVLRQPLTPGEPGLTAQVIATGPTVWYSAMPEVFETLMYEARRELVITTWCTRHRAQVPTGFQKTMALFQPPRSTFQSPRTFLQIPSPGGPSWDNRPWFIHPSVRRDLGLTEQQFNQFRQVYNVQYVRYQQDLSGLENLSLAERARRHQEMGEKFVTDFAQAAGAVLNAPQMNRLQQLELQQRGFAAFADPAVQTRLNLNGYQLQQITQLSQNFNAGLADIYKVGRTDPAEALRQYEAPRKRSLGSLDNTLVPQQQAAWREMTGQPFDIPSAFGADVPKT